MFILKSIAFIFFFTLATSCSTRPPQPAALNQESKEALETCDRNYSSCLTGRDELRASEASVMRIESSVGEKNTHSSKPLPWKGKQLCDKRLETCYNGVKRLNFKNLEEDEKPEASDK